MNCFGTLATLTYPRKWVEYTHQPEAVSLLAKAAFATAVALGIGTFGGTIPAQGAPVLELNGGAILTGVDGVVVDTGTYNVSFVPLSPQGSCTIVFSPCTSSTDFTFTNSYDADLATLVLAQVLSAAGYSVDSGGILGGQPGQPFFIGTPYNYCIALDGE